MAPRNLVDLVSLADYERRAAEIVSGPAWGYIAGGSEDERTLAENTAAFARLRLRPRVLAGVKAPDLATTVLGTAVAAPILVAPLGYHQLVVDEGERATARAAAAAGSLLVCATMATVSIEETAAAAPNAPLWFQLYVMRDRDLTQRMVARAEAAGARAIVLTVDVPRLGKRERDIRAGFSLPEGLTAANFAGAFGELGRRTEGASAIAAHAGAHFDDALDWGVLGWLRSITRLPIVLKGVLTGEDAARAASAGVDAIAVSNHGGRQLDGAPATIDVLAEVVDAAKGKCEVYLDGGIRRGTDVLKALALGARAVLVGRPILWGLAVDGERGANAVLDILGSELETALVLCGVRSVRDVRRDLVTRPRP